MFTTLPMDLTELTVPQLKAACKERRITGYSKLGKPALLQKLTIQNNSGTEPQNMLNMSVDANLAAAPPKSVKKLHAPKMLEVANPMQQKSSGVQDDGPSNVNTAETVSRTTVPVQPQFIPPGAVAVTKRSADLLNDAPNKKRRTLRKVYVDSIASVNDTLQSSSAQKSTPVTTNQSSESMAPPVPRPTKAHGGSGTTVRMQTTVTSSKPISRFLPFVPIMNNTARHTGSTSMQTAFDVTLPLSRSIEPGLKMHPNVQRFKPLVINKNIGSPKAVPSTKLSHEDSSKYTISSGKVAPGSSLRLYHLDFPGLLDSLVLMPITLPPKLSQRKRVHTWSIILSGLSNEERRRCTLVSRMFRYSVFLSAVRVLKQNYNGHRLARFMLKYPQNTTNLWPYLRQRELEVKTRIQAYNESFLAAYFNGLHPISEGLRTSPDHEHQLVVAVRFILTRLWFLVSIGGGGSSPPAWSHGIVVDAQEVVKDEIWTVTVQTPASQPDDKCGVEIFYVLEQTCEVVGRPLPSANPIDSAVAFDGLLSRTVQVRADWSAYIAHRQLPLGAYESPPLPLLSHLKWQNHEEYVRGISKLWLKRIEGEGALGLVKKTVANRYILACVVGNSISGSWMSSTEMEHAFAGRAAIMNSKTDSQKLQLFLPAHHHVESLHFTTANGSPLHEALAVVQTPGREYYILRDNGAQVGCGLGEEDGIGPIWMQLLECTALGERRSADEKN